MPRAWTQKDERQYRKVKRSRKHRGREEERAKEIAARTVNETRRRQDRTRNETSMGRGNPNRPLEERSREELYNRARDLQVRGRSRMDKKQLVRAIRLAS